MPNDQPDWTQAVEIQAGTVDITAGTVDVQNVPGTALATKAEVDLLAHATGVNIAANASLTVPVVTTDAYQAIVVVATWDLYDVEHVNTHVADTTSGMDFGFGAALVNSPNPNGPSIANETLYYPCANDAGDTIEVAFIMLAGGSVALGSYWIYGCRTPIVSIPTPPTQDTNVLVDTYTGLVDYFTQGIAPSGAVSAGGFNNPTKIAVTGTAVTVEGQSAGGRAAGTYWGVWVRALYGNANLIEISGWLEALAFGAGFEMAPGDAVFIEVRGAGSNAAPMKLCDINGTAGDGVCCFMGV